mmetsp:Transcript_19091/g.27977  ORF Transcript_19091/g.27977 Transcript_19091/m.27977 type:complete len:260 (+) Transcript_19091:772-1551(+)
MPRLRWMLPPPRPRKSLSPQHQKKLKPKPKPKISLRVKSEGEKVVLQLPKKKTKTSIAEKKAALYTYTSPPSTIPKEGEDERMYPEPGPTNPLDIFCQLCLRRNVVGGMKPVVEEHAPMKLFCHMSCTMSTREAFLGAGGIVYLDRALAKSSAICKRVQKEINTEIKCEVCGLSGGLLLQCMADDCALNRISPKKKRRRLSKDQDDEKPPTVCNKFFHPLCAEIKQYEQVIDFSGENDVISYKCAAHSDYTKAAQFLLK